MFTDLAPSADRRARLRDNLIAAAEHIIDAQGLGGLKARELARAANCALGAIYTVFADLDALVLAVSARTLASLDRHLACLEPATAPRPEASDIARKNLTLLALTYLDFAAAHGARWRALFEHRLPAGQPVPEWLMADQARLFGKVEAMLHPLLPQTTAGERALLARSLFSAVHGVVALGLEEKLAPMPLDVLRQQLARVVAAMTAGLARGG